MPGGSPEPDERESESQCIHCGRWYLRRGVKNHEANCPWAPANRRIHDLVDPFARMRAGLEPHPDDDSSADDRAEDVVDVVQEASDDAPDTTGDVQEATDGGPLSLPDFDVDRDHDRADAADGTPSTPAASSANSDPTCPACGGTDVASTDDLPDELLDAAPRLAQRDVFCVECSTDDDAGSLRVVEDDDGRPSLHVEAFDVDDDVAADRGTA